MTRLTQYIIKECQKSILFSCISIHIYSIYIFSPYITMCYYLINSLLCLHLPGMFCIVAYIIKLVRCRFDSRDLETKTLSLRFDLVT